MSIFTYMNTLWLSFILYLDVCQGGEGDFFLFFKLIFIGYDCFTMLYLVFSIQQNESAVHIHISLLFSSFSFRSTPQVGVKCRVLCAVYAVSQWSSVLYTVSKYLCVNLSLPVPLIPPTRATYDQSAPVLSHFGCVSGWHSVWLFATLWAVACKALCPLRIL